MTKNYPILKKILSIIFLLFCFSVFSQTADFKVQHIQDDVARTGGTNTTFTAVSSLNNAIELANNNRKTNAGRSDLNNGALEGHDLSGARVLTAPGILTYYREGASSNNNMRFNTSIWEYIGPALGNNEIIVRGRYAIALNGITNSVTQALSGIVNANKCIPFITGIMNNSNSDDADSGTAIAYLENATTLRVQKGSNANNVTVYITLVEFTGSNWTVLHGDSGSTNTDTGTITLRNGSDGTGAATNVSSWSDAIIFGHFRADNNATGTNDAIADLWPITDPGGNLQTVDWRFHSDHDSNGNNRHFVHVLANTGLNVTRYQNNSNVDNESTVDITAAGLTDVNQSLIVGSSNSSGTGTVYGRGWRNYYLKSATQAAHWAHRSGNTMAHEIQIIDLTGLTSPCNISNNTFDFTTGNYGTTSASVAEGASATLTAPAGKYFMYVGFASYGTPTGTAPNFAIGGCHATTSQSVTEGYLFGNNAAVIPATNAFFGDPCVGTFKKLNIQASYATPICYGASPGLITGTTPTGGNGTYTYLWESSTTSATTGFGNAAGTNNAKNYTPPALTQTTWYRRTVTSGGCSNISAVFQIKVNASISAPTTTGALICIGSTATLSASGAVATERYVWYNAATGGTLLKTSTNNTDNTYVTPVIAATTNYWVSILNSGGCESVRAIVAATFPAISPDSQTTAGTDIWIGHVYDGTNFGVAYNGNFTNYYGTFTEPETFNELFGGNTTCFAINSSLGGRSIYTETFAVRYRMNSTRKGLYVVDLGSDDGSRLTVDGTLIYNNWSDQGWTLRPRVLMSLTGSSALLYDFYENGGGNRVNFNNLIQILSNTLSTNTSQNICQGKLGDAISGDTYGTLPTGISLSGTGYQWAYSTTLGGVRTNISGATGATFTPNASIAPFNSPGTYYVYRNASVSSTNNIGASPYVATNESNVATIVINGINTWNGSVSSDWNNAANWCSGVPNLITNNLDVLIPSGLLTNYPVISAGDAAGEVVNIVFENNTTLNIIDNSLRVTGNLTLNGIIDLEGESQLLQDTGSVLDAASTGTIEIDQQGEGNKFRYNYWSMPVYTANDGTNYTTIFASLRDGTNPSSPGPIAFTSGYNGMVAPFTLSSFWMYKFVDSGAGYSAWNPIGSTGKLYTGQGFTMKGPGDPGSPAQNYVFVGKPNNGTIELDVNAGNEYLVGNPYPSAIDANQFLIDNGPLGTGIIGVGGALQFWEHFGGDTHNLAGYQAGYATYNLAGGVSASANPPVAGISTLGTSLKGKPGRYIPVGQAFFVVGNIIGKIQFNNGQRIFVKESQLDVNGDSISVFMKSNITKSKTVTTGLADLRPKFRIGFDAPKISHRQLLLTIDERATQAVDWGYEAEIYEIFADDMYWMLNNKKYVIQGTNEVGLNSEVPLGMQLSKTGLVTIKIDALENVDENIAVYLKDKLTGETFNMKDKPVQLNLLAGKYADRFALTFKTQKLMDEDVVAEVLVPAAAPPINEGIHVYMNNAIGELQIKNDGTEEILSVALINSLGQRVNYWDTNLNQRTISLPVSSVTGVYLVQINAEKGATNKKIVVD